ncbi:oligosaccharide flippase family protein, partial [Candidatus Uhrbacteria bacterium]|nr:oligosaccharide flippase family protein [Candidatus Uhrbacteria bacterium]
MSILSLKQQILRLLKWSQKYTQTDMVYLAHGSFWMMLRQFTTSLIAFGMAIAFANLLPKETYGAYKYVLSTSILLAITTLSGMNTSLTRSVAKGFEGSLIPALLTRMKWGILGSFLTLGLVLYYGVEGNSALTTVFVFVALFLPFKSSFSVYQAYWQGKQRFDLFSKYAIFQELLATVPMLIALFFTDRLFLIVLTYFCAQTAASALFYFLTQHRLSNHSHDPETVSYGKHISYSGVLFAVANNCTDVILWHLLGPVPVA